MALMEDMALADCGDGAPLTDMFLLDLGMLRLVVLARPPCREGGGAAVAAGGRGGGGC